MADEIEWPPGLLREMHRYRVRRRRLAKVADDLEELEAEVERRLWFQNLLKDQSSVPVSVVPAAVLGPQEELLDHVGGYRQAPQKKPKPSWLRRLVNWLW